MLIENQLFPAEDWQPGPESDALHLCGEQEYRFSNCIIDTRNCSSIDEAVGITHGASAVFDKCQFIGAGKLVLIGSGDKEWLSVEEGKRVVFNNCHFAHFGRRGPEVQSGMSLVMDSCLIEMWGNLEHFSERAFGVRVHDGARASLINCLFRNSTDGIPLRYKIKDRLSHIGQAVNDHGIKALIQKRTYASGWLRGCTVEGDAELEVTNCWKSDDRIIVDNMQDSMDNYNAQIILDWYAFYFDYLRRKIKQARHSV